MRGVVALVSLCLLTAFPDASARPETLQAQTPSFRAGVQMVEVDARVFDSDGRFVPDLTIDDFELFEDGEPQQVQTLFLVGGEPRSSSDGDSASPRAPREGPRGPHTWIFVVDQRHMSLNGFVRARSAITSFLAERFRDGDLAGIVFNDRMIDDRISSTREEYLSAVEKLVQPHGDIAGSISGGDTGLLRATATLNTLDELAAGLAAMPGPKTVVLLSDGFKYARLIRLAGTLRNVVGTFAGAGARIYAVDTRGIAGAPEHGLNSLAVDTGGLVLFNLNDIGAALDEISVDTNTYYVMGYQPTNTHFNSAFRRIEVRVTRPGLTVRARQGYLALPPSLMRLPK